MMTHRTLFANKTVILFFIGIFAYVGTEQGVSNWISQFLANRGYAVFMPNFRGSTGYGKQYLNTGNKQWGTGFMQHDITDGVQYLIKEKVVDPKRVGIFGGSYGGYATLAGVAFTPDLYAAGVSCVGPSNIITLLKTIPPYWAPIKRTFAIRLATSRSRKTSKCWKNSLH